MAAARRAWKPGCRERNREQQQRDRRERQSVKRLDANNKLLSTRVSAKANASPSTTPAAASFMP
jgi:hypothetical protein